MDKGTFRILLVSLASFELALIIGAMILIYSDKTVPDWMSTAIVAVITGILGLAVHQQPAEPMQVVNAPGAPVEVAPVPVHKADDGVDTLL